MQAVAELQTRAANAQRGFQSGTVSREDMIAAQRSFDLARTQPERDATLARSRAAQVRQQEVYDSIAGADPKAVEAMAADLDCIRTVEVEIRCRMVSVTRYVPPTGHWAHWRDKDAVLHHGMRSIDDLLERFAALSSEPWNGSYGHLWEFNQN